ncbi:hypothetical protein BJX64DRAFT_285615 [Aspergillus heterothallicus]
MKFPHLLSRLAGSEIAKSSTAPAIQPISPSQTTSEAINSEAKAASWSLVGTGRDHLLEHLSQLYWDGLTHELGHIILTLQAWNSSPSGLHTKDLPEETDSFIHGFDTFIDAVHIDSRSFASQVASLKERVRGESENVNIESSRGNTTHDSALENRAHELLLRYGAEKIKGDIRSRIEEITENASEEEKNRRRVRGMLQAMGVLDIETVVEDRSPVDDAAEVHEEEKAVPQLRLERYTPAGIPVLAPLQCSYCKRIIEGTMYRSLPQQDQMTICESCYRKHCRDTPNQYTKRYKHCILDEIINPSISRKMCLCETVPHHEPDGRPRSLFPVSGNDNHMTADGPGCVGCGLLKLPELIAEAKYEGLRMASGAGGGKSRRVKAGRTQCKPANAKSKASLFARSRFVTLRSKQLVNKGITTGATAAAGEAAAKHMEDLSSMEQETLQTFGNMPMSLRLGPLVIGNGVSNSKDGAVISLRDNLVFSRAGVQTTSPTSSSYVLDEAGQLWFWDQARIGRRYKAIMKQVVGTPFTEYAETGLETRIIDALILASKEPPLLDSTSNVSENNNEAVTERLGHILAPIIRDLKELLALRLSVYLNSLVSRLLDPDVTLRQSRRTKNYAEFCGALIEFGLFGPLFGRPVLGEKAETESLYLVSFVTRRPQACLVQPPEPLTDNIGIINSVPEPIVKPGHEPWIKSKFDTPLGLTEEYLLHSPPHTNTSDLIDSLHEYWHDWASLSEVPYHYQDLFPWDCTEAFHRYPGTCGRCNLAKHVWACPFDSWGVISLHLSRERDGYPLGKEKDGDEEESWMRNRLLLLAAQSTLTLGFLAMSRNTDLREATYWLHDTTSSNNADGTVRPDLDRVKHSGIHRAQPFTSNHHSTFPPLPNNQYTNKRFTYSLTAPWVHLPQSQRLISYEFLRDGRARLPDINTALEEKLDYSGKAFETIQKEWKEQLDRYTRSGVKLEYYRRGLMPGSGVLAEEDTGVRPIVGVVVVLVQPREAPLPPDWEALQEGLEKVVMMDVVAMTAVVVMEMEEGDLVVTVAAPVVDVAGETALILEQE